MRGFKKTKVRTIDVENGEIKEYQSLSDCGKEFGVSSAAISYWIKRDVEKNGKRFEALEKTHINGSISEVYDNSRPCFVEDENGNIVGEYDSICNMAQFYGVTSTTMRYRIRMEKPFNGLYFKLTDKTKIQVSKSILSKGVYDDNVVLNREKYRILSYQTKNHVCITPCPFLQSPKPMIGSGRCMYCTSFRGRSVKTNEIACNRKYF